MHERPPASTPLVSVVIPTYRQAGLIGRAVQSALLQDYPNLEVVVSDDCSPDQTPAVVAGFADARLRYHRNAANIGRVANYRRGLYELARGEWVLNLDGDDYLIDSGFIRAAIETASADEDVVIVAARAETRTPTGVFVSKIPPVASIDGRLVALRAARREYHLMHLASLFRRRAALPLEFYRLDAISSDLESLYRLACHGKVCFIDRTVGVWNVDASSASQTDQWQSLARNMRIWKAIGGELVATGVGIREARRAMNAAAFAIGYVNAARLLASGHVLGALRFVASMQDTALRVKARLLLYHKLLVRIALAALSFRRSAVSR